MSVELSEKQSSIQPILLTKEPEETTLVDVEDDSVLHQSIEERFRYLVKVWQSERPPSSHMSVLIMHPAYQQIIGLGPAAIPLLLKELQHNLDWWVIALHTITGANPIPKESRGKLKEMAQAWIAWGKQYGYIT